MMICNPHKIIHIEPLHTNDSSLIKVPHSIDIHKHRNISKKDEKVLKITSL